MTFGKARMRGSQATHDGSCAADPGRADRTTDRHAGSNTHTERIQRDIKAGCDGEAGVGAPDILFAAFSIL